MTLLVRDEQDIIATNIDYHLSQGIDTIIVTDNLSADNTPSILANYEKKGLVKVIKETSDDYSQHKWVTRMAQMAYTDYAADWVINNDADEFWLPEDPSRTIKQVLAEIPADILACKAQRVNFLPPSLAHENIFFADAMTVREVQSFNTIGQPLAPKTCHRGFPDIIVKQGNHHVEMEGVRLQPIDMPITILHFPLRSFTQFENKISKGGAAYERNKDLDKGIGITWRDLYTKHLEGTLFEYYCAQIPTKETILSELDSGKLVSDRRLIETIHKNLDDKKLSNQKHTTHMIHHFFSRIKNKLIPKRSKNNKEGIITLADKNYFQGLILLYQSVQDNYPVPMVCFDIGLSDNQIRWAGENMPLVTIQAIPDNEMIKTIKNYKEKTVLAKKGKRQWPLWICPFLIQNSPFTKTLWLDCDLIVLRNLDKLFKKLDAGPFFTPENLAPQVTANKPELYQLLPIERKFDENNALINAGVSGWHLQRDKTILADYAKAVSKAFENEQIKNAISWHDQGALIWAILNNGFENRIAKHWEWNLCVKHTSARGLKFTWNKTILEQLRQKVPEANILHWNGQAVPWK